MSETSPDQVQPGQDPTNVGQTIADVGADLDPGTAAQFISDARTKIENGSATEIDRRMVEAHDADLGGKAASTAVKTEAQPSPAPAAAENEPAVIPVESPEAPAEPVAEPAQEDEPKIPVEDRTVEERTIVNDALGSTERRIKDLEAEIAGKWGKEDTSELQAELESDESLLAYLRTDKTVNDPTQIRLNRAEPSSEAEDTTPTAETPLLGEDGLVDRLAKARLNEDRTSEDDIEDAIADRIAAKIQDQNEISEEGVENLVEQMEKLATKREEELRQAATEAREAEAAAAAATPVEAEPTTAGETPETGTDGDGNTPEAEANNEDDEPTTPEAEALLEEALDALAVRYGQAKAAGEKTLSRKAQRSELDESSEALKEAFDQMIEASVETMHFTDETLQNAKEINAEVRESVLTQLNDLRQEKLNREGPYDHEIDQELDDKIINLEAELNRCELSAESIQAELDGAPGLREEYIANRVMGLQKRISDTVIQERTRNHGKFAKVTEWMQRHKGTRMLASAGLTGLGIFGVVTANAPLYLSTNALKRGLTGYGSYEMTRSIGALKAGRNMSKAETDTIDSYLKASMRETTTMRRFNRASIIVGGALLTLGPTVFSVIDHYFHGGGTPASNGGGPRVINNGVRGGGGGAPRIIGSQSVTPGGGAATAAPVPSGGGTASLASATAPTSAVQIPSVSGNTLPWSFGMDTLHTNISDPSVLDHILNNQYGISFSGNGAGGGSGAFTSVTIPGQGTFTDPGHINGALEYILNNGGGSTV